MVQKRENNNSISRRCAICNGGKYPNKKVLHDNKIKIYTQSTPGIMSLRLVPVVRSPTLKAL